MTENVDDSYEPPLKLSQYNWFGLASFLLPIFAFLGTLLYIHLYDKASPHYSYEPLRNLGLILRWAVSWAIVGLPASVVALAFGHAALLPERPRAGRGWGIAGLVIAYPVTALTALLALFVLASWLQSTQPLL